MYAVVEVGNSQFKVSEGDVIHADRLSGAEGSQITLEKVLMYAAGSDIRVGQPFVPGVTVTATVEKHFSADKVIAFKYRRRSDSATKKAQRHKLTALNITKISA